MAGTLDVLDVRRIQARLGVGTGLALEVAEGLFVSSPVGPALWSGDAQARARLSPVVREAVYSRAYT